MPNYNSFLGMLIMGNDAGTATSFDIDSALVFGTSGDSIGHEHSCCEALSNQTLKLHVYVSGVTGLPISMTAYIYDCAGSGDDIDRMDDDGGGLKYTSSVVDFSGGAGWKEMVFTGVTWAASRTMWFVLANTTALPNLNFPSVQIRGALDGPAALASGAGRPQKGHTSYSNTSGWTADGTEQGGTVATYVVEYPSGNSYGNPYVAVGAHASNTNYRGNRITPTEDLKISGFWGAFDTNFASMHVAQGASDSLAYTITGDLNGQQSAGGARFNPITLTGGLAWDIVQKAGANDTFGVVYDMGTSPPAAVQNAGGPLRYVDGATLGSLTLDSTKYYAMWLEVCDNPAISGGTTNGFFYS